MEIIDKNVAMLSNFEVYDFLLKSEKEAKKDKKSNRSQNLDTISYETKEYLSRTACVNQSEDVIKNTLSALAKYPLTKAEKLQLLNLRPEHPVDIQVIIEEIEERLTEQEIDDILLIIKTHIPCIETENELMKS